MVRVNTYTILLVVLLFGSSSIAHGQQQKIGYVDTDHILSEMPEYEGVQQQLQVISSEWNSQLKKMEEEINQLKEDFESREILYTEEQREQVQQKIQKLVTEREQFMDEKFGEEGEYFQKQKELLEPIQRKVFKAVNIIAKRNNFDFIFDRAQNTNMLYGNQEFNLNEKVLQELGLTLNESSN